MQTIVYANNDDHCLPAAETRFLRKTLHSISQRQAKIVQQVILYPMVVCEPGGRRKPCFVRDSKQNISQANNDYKVWIESETPTESNAE